MKFHIGLYLWMVFGLLLILRLIRKRQIIDIMEVEYCNLEIPFL